MKPGLKVERRRQARIVDARQRPQVQKKVRNLQQPRQARMEGDWDQLLKHAVSQAVKTAQSGSIDFYETEQMQDLVDRIAQLYQQRDPDYFTGQGLTKSEWVDRVVSDPLALGHTLKQFGRSANAPLFERMGADIVGYGSGLYGPSRRERAQQFVQPDQPQAFGADLADRMYSTSQAPTFAGTQRRLMEQGARDLETKISLLDHLGNVVDLAVPNRWVSLAATVGPEFAAGYFGAQPMELQQELDRPRIQPYLPLAERTLDFIDARENLRHAQETQGFPQIQKAEERARLARRAMEDVARQVGPLPDRPGAGIGPTLQDTTSALSIQTSMALSPTVFPVFSALGRLQQDVQQDLMQETTLGSPESPEMLGRILTQEVAGIPAGTEITPEVQQRLAQADTGQVTAVTPKGYQLLNQSLVDQAGQSLTSAPGRTGTRAMQTALEVLGAHKSRRALHDMVSSGAQLLPERSPAWAQKAFQSAQKQLAQSSLAEKAWRSRPVQAGVEAGRTVSRWGARPVKPLAQAVARLPGIERVRRAASAAGRAGDAALARLFGRSGQPATAQLGRAQRLARGLRGFGAGSVLFSGAESMGEIYQSLSPEAREQLTEDIAALGVQDMQHPFWQRRVRDVLAIPEAVFLDRDYARQRLGATMAQMGLGDEYRAEQYRQARAEHRIDRETARQYGQALEDLQQVLPGVEPQALHYAAGELALNRALTNEGMLSSNRQVSQYEDQLLRSPVGQSLSETERSRVSQLIREIGPEAFNQVFFFDTDRGAGVPDTHAWRALQQGVEVELPTRFTRDVAYRNPFEETRASRHWEREQQAQQAQEQQQVEQHRQRMAELGQQEQQIQQEHQTRQQEIQQVSQALATERQKTRRTYEQYHADRLAALDQGQQAFESAMSRPIRPTRRKLPPPGVQLAGTPRVDPPPVVPDNQHTAQLGPGRADAGPYGPTGESDA